MGSNVSCCGNQSVDTTHDVKGYDFNLREFNNSTKLRAIVRIQARIRGYMDRKKVQKILNPHEMSPMMH